MIANIVVSGILPIFLIFCCIRIVLVIYFFYSCGTSDFGAIIVLPSTCTM